MLSGSGCDRIYIGGLDPFKLTVDEVLQRLRDQLPASCKLENIYYSSQRSSASYVHFTVVPTVTLIDRNDNIDCDSSDNRSDDAKDFPKSESDVFEQISKLLHNVKWKGCKLKVERAKPHFLDRLRKEIEDRKQLRQLNTGTTKSSNADDAENDNPDVYSIPRYLKVKRGYGQECWKVDTKPFSVNDWRTFIKLTKQVKTKREAYQKSSNDNQMDKDKNSNRNLSNEKASANNSRADMTYYNRSIHLRFVDPDDENNKDDHVLQYKPNDEGYQVLKRHDNITSGLLSAESLDESNENIVNDHLDEVSDSDDSSDRDSVHHESGSDGESTGLQVKSVSLERVPTEFDNGIDDQAESSDEESENDSGSVDNVENNEECNSVTSLDLNKDVANNLSILSQMFPEMIRRKDLSKSKEAVEQNDSNKKEPKTKVGWTESGQILRYDPKSFSKQQNNEKNKIDEGTVLSEEEEEGDDKSVDEDIDVRSDNDVEDDDDNNDDEFDMNDDERIKPDSTSRPSSQQNLYDQQKLEDVFREAREISSHQHVFGFLPDNEEIPPAVQKFTFGFSLPSENVTQDSFPIAAKVESEYSIEHNDESLSEFNANRLLEEVSQRPNRKRVRAYDLLDDNHVGGSEVLNKIVDFTYNSALAGGEGSKMLANLVRYRADSAVTEAWNKQRKWLTSDWKQKVKQGQAQGNKHHQFNKRGRSK